MDKWKKLYISVIIPAYNEEKYIRQTIVSVLKQRTKNPFEIIIVDNNSTDNTYQLIKKFNIRVFQQSQQGVAVTRNTGANQARGKVLVFLDADCIMPQGHLKKIETIFSSQSTIDAVGGPYIYHDGGEFISWITDNCNYFTFYFQLIKRLCGFQGFPGGNVAIRKKAFMEIGGFDESINSIMEPEDFNMVIRLWERQYNIQFTKDLRVISSFRRMNRALLSDGVQRFYHQIKYLIPLMLKQFISSTKRKK